MIDHAAKSNRKSMQRLLRSILAPGTTHACKSLFTEEVYVSVGFKADLSIFLDALKCELSDLLREECSRFMNRGRVRQQPAQAHQPRNSKSSQLPEFFLERPRTGLNHLMHDFPKPSLALSDRSHYGG